MGAFIGEKSKNLRVWHWLNALATTGLVFTYIFRKTWFNYKENAQILQIKLSEMGVHLADDKAQAIAKIFRDNMWQWHYYFGFLFAALLLFRLYAFVSKSEKFPTCRAKESSESEFKMAKYAHGAFYLVAVYMALSGLTMYFRESLGIDKESLHLVKELHEMAFWFFVVFAVGHISGVIKAELTTDRGLISEMFNGGDKK